MDYPISNKVFIHRCGRTARADKEGIAYCLFTHNEIPYVYEILNKINRTLSNDI